MRKKKKKKQIILTSWYSVIRASFHQMKYSRIKNPEQFKHAIFYTIVSMSCIIVFTLFSRSTIWTRIIVILFLFDFTHTTRLEDKVSNQYFLLPRSQNLFPCVHVSWGWLWSFHLLFVCFFFTFENVWHQRNHRRNIKIQIQNYGRIHWFTRLYCTMRL